MHKVLAALMVGTILSSGCATIVKGGHSDVEVVTHPSGAKIYLDDGYQQQASPVVLSLGSKGSYTIKACKAGYKDATTNITHHIGAGYLIADILLFPIGVIVDAVTENWYTMDDRVDLNLEPAK
ncbi:MAG: PEGA domain-containing protein [Bdellovibrionota bacterium]